MSISQLMVFARFCFSNEIHKELLSYEAHQWGGWDTGTGCPERW